MRRAGDFLSDVVAYREFGENDAKAFTMSTRALGLENDASEIERLNRVDDYWHAAE